MLLEEFSLNFSSWSFAIRVNLLHLEPSSCSFRFILMSLVFVFHAKQLFQDFFLFKRNFPSGCRNDSKYRDVAPLNHFKFVPKPETNRNYSFIYGIAEPVLYCTV